MISKRKLIVTILASIFLLFGVEAKAVADTFQNVEKEGFVFCKKKKNIKPFQNDRKRKKFLFKDFFSKKKWIINRVLGSFNRLFYKKNKKMPPRKGDDLWILKLIYLVALLSILTFVLSAIMLAIGGMSSLWLTLMIVGGIIGVLPFIIIIGAALLF
ncbi:MAG: hypothetical protein ACPG19_11375 [Saprospiraceae bacterium]